VIAQELNKSWTDSDGQRFTSYLTSAYDADVWFSNISNNMMINELKNGHPFVICNTHHCMLAMRIDYTAYNIYALYVFDPWPGQGYRQLTYPESVLVSNGGQCRFIATASIVDAPPPTNTTGTGSTGSSTGNGEDDHKSKVPLGCGKRTGCFHGINVYSHAWPNFAAIRLS
jgi:hypothetical protein